MAISFPVLYWYSRSWNNAIALRRLDGAFADAGDAQSAYDENDIMIINMSH